MRLNDKMIAALLAAFVAATTVSAGASSPPHTVITLHLPSGLTADVRSDGAAIERGPMGMIGIRHLHDRWAVAHAAASITAEHRIVDELLHATTTPYAPNTVIVALRPGNSIATDSMLNAAVPHVKVVRIEHLFTHFESGQLDAMQHMAGAAHLTAPAIDLGSVYRIHIANATVPQAVQQLATSSSVAFAEPEWLVGPMIARGPELPAPLVRAANASFLREQNPFGESSLPTNYAVTASAQPMLNAPGVNAVAAYDEIERIFHQLPGEGEIITNVSLGDVDDSSAANHPADPCQPWVQAYGPTTRRIGTQRYLDLPAMPLIPAYTANVSGAITDQDACGIDPYLSEIGLDFSVMAPLPHNLQRPGEIGSGLGDLLGIAPGAKFRLVVPQTLADAGNTDIAGALLAAATQQPAPNVITTSIGFGYDRFGFPGRYLEEDPLVQTVIATIVNTLHITVCISANDGTRTFTVAAIGTAGGSAATNVASSAKSETTLSSVELSLAPSAVVDSGAIDAGGSTLDDIFSANPADPANHRWIDQHAFAQTRWNGFQLFSSGYGSRVNIAAPSDNIVALERVGPAYDEVAYSLNGGTSAAAPEVAAAAAVAMQVARLTGHPLVASGDVRSLLVANGTAVPSPPQSGVTLNVGTQIDLGKTVETLLLRGRQLPQPRVPRVAIALRNPLDPFDDNTFTENTDPANISPVNYVGSSGGEPNGDNVFLTIAPDWENLPASVRYRLFLSGRPSRPLSTSSQTRFLVAQLLSETGLVPYSDRPQHLALTYQALLGSHVLLTAPVDLTFAPTPTKDAANTLLLAPDVPAEVRGAFIPVHYDLRNSLLGTHGPVVAVTYPGRFNNSFPEINQGSLVFNPFVYMQHLTQVEGTAEIPVSALPGTGIYGIAILPQEALDPHVFRATFGSETDFAITHVTTGTRVPQPPLLSVAGIASPTHTLAIPAGGTFSVTYDCANTSATGAMLELSAPGPSGQSAYDNVNNPNGSVIDNDGHNTGSVAHLSLSGCQGTTTLDAAKLGLLDGGVYQLRLFPAAGGRIIGESSDASSVEIGDFVTPANDEAIAFSGFSVNPERHTGFLIAQEQPSFLVFSGSTPVDVSLERFNLDTGAVAAANAPMIKTASGQSISYGPTDVFRTLGLYSDDSALYQMFDLDGTTNISQHVAADSPIGGPQKTWTCTLCPGYFGPIFTGYSTSSSRQAVGFDAFANLTQHTPAQILAASSNVGANTTTAAINLTTLTKLQQPDLQGVDLDTETNTGYALIASAPGAVLASLDYASGSPHVAFDLGPSVLTNSLQIDSSTHIAAAITQEDSAVNEQHSGRPLYNAVALMNLANGSFVRAPYPDAYNPSFSFLTIDEVNHLVLVADLEPWNEMEGYNLTQGSQLIVMNEQGVIQKTIPLPYIDLNIYFSGTHLLGVDGTTRRLFMLCPSMTCIDAVHY